MFAMRVSMSDQPGALGALASALGRDGVNIVTLDVVEHRDGVAVDDLCVDVRDQAAMSEGLRRTAEEVRGAVVEAIKPLREARRSSPMHLAAEISESTSEDSLRTLIDRVPDAMWASWAVAIKKGSPTHVLCASSAAPSMSNVETPWLPLDSPRTLASAPWMPPAWCMGRMSYEVAAAPLRDPDTALLIARKHGPRFRPSEVEQLGLLTRILLTRSRELLPSAT